MTFAGGSPLSHLLGFQTDSMNEPASRADPSWPMQGVRDVLGRRAVVGLANSRASRTTAPDIRVFRSRMIPSGRLQGSRTDRRLYREEGRYSGAVDGRPIPDKPACESCEQDEATMARYGGFEWHPICDGCANWWGTHRLGPLSMLTPDGDRAMSNAALHAWQDRLTAERDARPAPTQ